MHADACEEQDASVEIDVEDEPLESAQDVSKYPVCFVEVVEDEEREREHVTKIRQRQVKHVDGDAAPRPHVTHEHPDGQTVSDEAREEDEDVDDGEIVELKPGLG